MIWWYCHSPPTDCNSCLLPSLPFIPSYKLWCRGRNFRSPAHPILTWQRWHLNLHSPLGILKSLNRTPLVHPTLIAPRVNHHHRRHHHLTVPTRLLSPIPAKSVQMPLQSSTYSHKFHLLGHHAHCSAQELSSPSRLRLCGQNLHECTSTSNLSPISSVSRLAAMGWETNLPNIRSLHTSVVIRSRSIVLISLPFHKWYPYGVLQWKNSFENLAQALTNVDGLRDVLNILPTFFVN